MSKGFSNEELKKIKQKLIKACEENWRLLGYKKTNIPLLTSKVGISTGAFYLIYKRKEDLFLDVLESVQKKLLNTWSQFLKDYDKKIEGFEKGLYYIFNEYRSYPNLYDFNSSEYDLFLAKLPTKKVDKLKQNSLNIFRTVIKQSELTLVLSENETINIIHSILFLSLVDSDTLQGTEQTFDFLINNTLYSLFEEKK